jgi:carboxymethylenebutenolidase
VNTSTGTDLTPAEQELRALWEKHLHAEFVGRNAQDAVETMTDDASVNNVPILIGATGKQGVQEFYSRYFLAQLPPDLEFTLLSRTVGQNRLVEELIFRFTHSLRMDWFLPGVEPTGKRVEVAVVGVIQFRDGKMAHEHLYWDQASVLVQLGLLDEETLPVAGVQVARRLQDATVPMNGLIRRAAREQAIRRG